MLTTGAPRDRGSIQPVAAARDLATIVAGIAEQALIDELMTWPKPGLVSHVDPGSHSDMDADTFRRGIAAITPFFARVAAAADADLVALRCLGLDAEAAMLTATRGVNTHRGAIFALGLLCAAAGRLSGRRKAADLVDVVRHRWSAGILGDRLATASHGTAAMLRFGVGGARGEAANGFPNAMEIGLPALRQGRLLGDDEEDARVHCFFALLARLKDTNLLHRAGATGLAFAQDAAHGFLAAGGIGGDGWRERASAIHRAFVARRLSPGGSADLLAVTLFLDRYEAPATVVSCLRSSGRAGRHEPSRAAPVSDERP